MLLSFRYHKLLLYLGIAPRNCKDLKIKEFCKIITEFSLEYKITREKIIHQLAVNARKTKEKLNKERQHKKKTVVDVRVLYLLCTQSNICYVIVENRQNHLWELWHPALTQSATTPANRVSPFISLTSLTRLD